MNDMNYQENKSAGLYIFVAVFCLTLIVKVEDTGNLTWMTVFFALVYGGMVWGFGLALWVGIGDMVMPYIYGRQHVEMIQPEIIMPDDILNVPSQPSQPSHHDALLERHIANRISDDKLWAKGAIILTGSEQDEMKMFMTDRWEKQTMGAPPAYVSAELIDKLKDRDVLDDEGWLTPYGITIVPFYGDVVNK